MELPRTALRNIRLITEQESNPRQIWANLVRLSATELLEGLKNRDDTRISFMGKMLIALSFAAIPKTPDRDDPVPWLPLAQRVITRKLVHYETEQLLESSSPYTALIDPAADQEFTAFLGSSAISSIDYPHGYLSRDTLAVGLYRDMIKIDDKVLSDMMGTPPLVLLEPPILTEEV